jgi:hypothetical protein
LRRFLQKVYNYVNSMDTFVVWRFIKI